MAERILRWSTICSSIRTIGSTSGWPTTTSLLFGYALVANRPAQSRLPAAHPAATSIRSSRAGGCRSTGEPRASAAGTVTRVVSIRCRPATDPRRPPVYRGRRGRQRDRRVDGLGVRLTIARCGSTLSMYFGGDEGRLVAGDRTRGATGHHRLRRRIGRWLSAFRGPARRTGMSIRCGT